jgi:hypothetical protein
MNMYLKVKHKKRKKGGRRKAKGESIGSEHSAH